MRLIYKITISVFILWTLGFGLFIFKISQQKMESSTAEAAIVLTGGTGRINEGIKLLKQGKVTKLFITGVNPNFSKQILFEQVKDSQNFYYGTDAKSTRGNAIEASDWIEKNQIRNILLVTSNYHMPRSILEFSKTNSGLVITPYPVFSSNFQINNWWFDSNTITILLS